LLDNTYTFLWITNVAFNWQSDRKREKCVKAKTDRYTPGRNLNSKTLKVFEMLFLIISHGEASA
tara:strand:- start:549 stop:740 length:192 start_codon:yes stop_codon:yes gene_type:complete